MPYTITTHRPGKHERPIEDGDRYSRRAVATLEDAREHLRCELPGAYEWITDGDYADMMADIVALPESGGTVGPLPDGTVIEVAQVSWLALGAGLKVENPTDQKILDAYNAAKGER